MGILLLMPFHVHWPKIMGLSDCQTGNALEMLNRSWTVVGYDCACP